ncbi:hypothetical protein KIPB_014581, partial [Kipferlia bialata]|eukprot:g14581.t1
MTWIQPHTVCDTLHGTFNEKRSHVWGPYM